MNEPAKSLVLVVDDSEDLSDFVRMVLEEKGYKVEVAANGKIALEKIATLLPQLILLDMRMPVMDGWEFAKHFHDLYGRAIPIVVMTVAEDSKLRADEVGADSYLGKPLDVTRLLEVVEDTANSEKR